jgi:hypothetical protein
VSDSGSADRRVGMARPRVYKLLSAQRGQRLGVATSPSAPSIYDRDSRADRSSPSMAGSGSGVCQRSEVDGWTTFAAICNAMRSMDGAFCG